MAYILSEISGKLKPYGPTGGTLPLVQVMAWCREATSHYLNQCSPNLMTPYSISGPNELKTPIKPHCIERTRCQFAR